MPSIYHDGVILPGTAKSDERSLFRESDVTRQAILPLWLSAPKWLGGAVAIAVVAVTATAVGARPGTPDATAAAPGCDLQSIRATATVGTTITAVESLSAPVGWCRLPGGELVPPS